MEQRLCASMAEQHPRNYYAWNHRLWLLQFMSVEQLEAELRWTHNWLRTHVSDHSAANHLEQTIVALSAAVGAAGSGADTTQTFRATLATVLQQVDHASAAVESRPGHETLWYHKRKLFLFVLQLLTHHDSKVRRSASNRLLFVGVSFFGRTRVTRFLALDRSGAPAMSSLVRQPRPSTRLSPLSSQRCRLPCNDVVAMMTML